MTDLDDNSSPEGDFELVKVTIIDPLKNGTQDSYFRDIYLLTVSPSM